MLNNFFLILIIFFLIIIFVLDSFFDEKLISICFSVLAMILVYLYKRFELEEELRGNYIKIINNYKSSFEKVSSLKELVTNYYISLNKTSDFFWNIKPNFLTEDSIDFFKSIFYLFNKEYDKTFYLDTDCKNQLKNLICNDFNFEDLKKLSIIKNKPYSIDKLFLVLKWLSQYEEYNNQILIFIEKTYNNEILIMDSSDKKHDFKFNFFENNIKEEIIKLLERIFISDKHIFNRYDNLKYISFNNKNDLKNLLEEISFIEKNYKNLKKYHNKIENYYKEDLEVIFKKSYNDYLENNKELLNLILLNGK